MKAKKVITTVVKFNNKEIHTIMRVLSDAGENGDREAQELYLGLNQVTGIEVVPINERIDKKSVKVTEPWHD